MLEFMRKTKVRSLHKIYKTFSSQLHNYYYSGDVEVQSNITFSLDSELTAETPQFTLTCTSTAGPATTVTWTRDSETVSGEEMSVLNDPVTAHYTHTLTVTGRLGGLYVCIVSNNKPSTAMKNLSVVGMLYNL